jgi:membrane-associated PAP2 superfamily phosphatase
MMGDGRTQFGMAGAFGLYGLVTSDERALRTGSQIVQAVLSSGTVVQVLKHITGRQSPYVSSERGGAWVFFPNQIDYHKRVPYYDAFPSGHIATSTATVVVIAENYPDSKWIRPVGFTIVGLIGIGMAGTGIHWYSDYPLGIALGYIFGLIAAHPEGIDIGKVTQEHGLQMSLVPTVDGSGIGIGFKFTL